jgi:hypothetical protein
MVNDFTDSSTTLLKFLGFSPDEALKRAAYVKLPKIGKSSSKSR